MEDIDKKEKYIASCILEITLLKPNIYINYSKNEKTALLKIWLRELECYSLEQIEKAYKIVIKQVLYNIEPAHIINEIKINEAEWVREKYKKLCLESSQILQIPITDEERIKIAKNNEIMFKKHKIDVDKYKAKQKSFPHHDYSKEELNDVTDIDDFEV